MNACTHLYQSTCPRYPRKPSPGICKRCEKFSDSGVERVPLTIAATRKQSLQVQPVPRAEWPLLARVVARLRNDTDTGIGDTIQRSLGTAGEFYKQAYKSLTGKSCGCSDRQKYLNQLYAY